jgi:integrase
MKPKRGNPDQYLRKIGHTYYARVRVPRTLERIVKQTHLQRSLKTTSRADANLRKHAAVAEMKAELAACKASPPTEGLPLTFADARAIREQLERLRDDGDDAQVEAVEGYAANRAEVIERLHGVERAGRWFRAATVVGENLSELQAHWLAGADYKESTKAGHRKALKEVLEYLRKDDAMPSEVTLKVAVRYIDTDLIQRGLAHATIRDRLVSLGGFWKWMGSRGAVPKGEKPWTDHRISKTQNKGRGPEKRGYTDDEVLRLLKGNDAVKGWPTYSYLPDLVILGLFTGAREDELCSMVAERVTAKAGGYVLQIIDAKSKAGWRFVAVIDSAPVAVLKRRLKGLKGKQQVFPELKPGGLDKKLSSSAVKAYVRYRRACAVPDGTDFHSYRRMVVTVLERAKVDQVSIARFVGHKVGTLAADTYSDGASEGLALELAPRIRFRDDIERQALALATR